MYWLRHDKSSHTKSDKLKLSLSKIIPCKISIQSAPTVDKQSNHSAASRSGSLFALPVQHRHAPVRSARPPLLPLTSQYVGVRMRHGPKTSVPRATRRGPEVTVPKVRRRGPEAGGGSRAGIWYGAGAEAVGRRRWVTYRYWRPMGCTGASMTLLALSGIICK
jgi:hypothetical protein